MNNNSNKSSLIISVIQKYLPIVVIELYLFFIIYLFLYGNLNYIIDNKHEVVIYLIICNIAIALGYIVVTVKYKASSIIQFPKLEGMFLKYFWALILLGVILLVLRINVTIKIDSITTYINAFSTGLVDPTQQYIKQYFTIPADVKLKILFYIGIDGIFSALTFSIIPLSIMYKEKLSFVKHIGFYLYMLFIVSFEICKGSNSGNYILAIIVLISILLKAVKDMNKLKLSWLLRHIDLIIFIILLAAFCVGFFQFSLGERTGGSLTNTFAEQDNIQVVENDNVVNSNNESVNGVSNDTESQSEESNNVTDISEASNNVDESNNTLEGDELQTAYQYYLTSSLRNLSAAFHEKWVPTYGFGHSQVLSSILENVVGVNMFQNTYTNRLRSEGKINIYTVAPTYADIASDVTFPGSIAVMVIVGGLIAFFWKNFISGDNVLSFLFMVLWALFIITLPGLNLILNNYYYYFVFMSYIAIFIIYHIIKIYRKKRMQLNANM